MLCRCCDHVGELSERTPTNEAEMFWPPSIGWKIHWDPWRPLHLVVQAHGFPSPLVNVYSSRSGKSHKITMFTGKCGYLGLPVGFPGNIPYNPSTLEPWWPWWAGRPRCGHRHHYAAAAESGGCGEGHPKLGALRFSPRKWRVWP